MCTSTYRHLQKLNTEKFHKNKFKRKAIKERGYCNRGTHNVYNSFILLMEITEYEKWSNLKGLVARYKDPLLTDQKHTEVKLEIFKLIGLDSIHNHAILNFLNNLGPA